MKILNKLTAAAFAIASLSSIFIPLRNNYADAVTIDSISAAAAECVQGSNQLSKYMSRWGTVISGYIAENPDGTICTVDGSGNNVAINNYDSSFSHISELAVESELPIFGGYYCGSEYNFLLFGQENPDENDDLEVIRVVKYSKEWERLGSTSFFGCNTCIPFDAGTPRMYESGGNLYIHTSHEMYMSSDGYNHQANFQIHIDIDSMTCTYSFYGVMNIRQQGYSSHSFDQYIRADGSDVYTLDHGDAYPRSAAICKKNSAGKMQTYIEAFPITGSVGDNTTGATLGGFELTDDGCMFIGNSMLQDGMVTNTSIRNVFVNISDRALTSAKTIWLTDFDDGYRVSKPKLTKIDGNTFIAMWNEYGDKNLMHIMKLDKDGNILEEASLAAEVSCCDPIVVGSEIIWYTSTGSKTTFYHLEYGNISQYDGLGEESETTTENPYPDLKIAYKDKDISNNDTLYIPSDETMYLSILSSSGDISIVSGSSSSDYKYTWNTVTIEFESMKNDTYTVIDNNSGQSISFYSYVFDPLYGDANLDEEVDMDDVVAVMCYSAGFDSDINERGIYNGDVYQHGDGLSSNDAVVIQKSLALLLDNMPESYI